MKRRLLTLAAVASLVLCVATVALWVRSYTQPECLAYVSDIDEDPPRPVVDMSDQPSWSRWAWHDEWGVTSARGLLSFYHNRSDSKVRAGAWVRELLPKGWHFSRDERVTTRWLRARTGLTALTGLSFSSYGQGPPKAPAAASATTWEYTHVLTLPHWMLALATILLPSYAGYRIHRRRSRCGARCPTCGYDLRATPQRCPECGGVPAETAAR